MKLSDRQKKLSDRQKMALALRRLQRALAVAIYPPLDQHTLDELDAEFQKGLEVGIKAQKWQQDINDARAERHIERAKENMR